MNFLAVCLTPPTKKLKKCQFEQGKSVQKALKICTFRFLGVQIAMQYVRTLCDKYFLTYDGFSLFLTGRFSATQAISMHFPSQNQQNAKFLKLNFILKLILNLTLILKLNLILNLTMNVILKLNFKLILNLVLKLNLILKLTLKLILNLILKLNIKFDHECNIEIELQNKKCQF